jgi:hypothetical protein
MKIAHKYSHLNGEEYLLVHYPELYEEIKQVIANVNAETHRTKVSKEKKMKGRMLFSPRDINNAIKQEFEKSKWKEARYSYYITLDRKLMEQTLPLDHKEQKELILKETGEEPLFSYNQTDFVKEKIAVEVQFGKYAFVAFDLFVKHIMFYTGGVINLGIEILPTKAMCAEMSSGIGYYEGEVYNVMRQGRNSPAVPLLILGIEPE